MPRFWWGFPVARAFELMVEAGDMAVLGGLPPPPRDHRGRDPQMTITGQPGRRLPSIWM